MPTEFSARQRIKHTLHLMRAVRLVWNAAPGWTMANFAVFLTQGVLPLLSLYLIKLVVDAVTAGISAPDKGEAFLHAALLIGLTGGVAIFSALCSSISELIRNHQSQVVTDHVSDILHAKSIEVDLEYYENPKYFDTLHRAQKEAPFRPTRIVNGLARVLQNGISLLAIAGLLFSLHWCIAVILLIAVVPGALVRLKYADKLFHWERESTQVQRRARYFNLMLTGDVHAKEVRLFNLGPIFINRFRNLRRQLRQARLTIATSRSIAEAAANITASLAIFGSFAFIAYRTIQGAITLGSLVMYFQAFQRGQGFLRETLTGLAGLYEDNLFLSNYYDFLGLEQKVSEPLHPTPIPRPMQRGIVFDHVSFQYPTSARRVLDDITLRIRPGEKVALVGENGAGKTTLIKLLCRLYDPSGGTITLDGVDLRRLKTTALRHEISVIFQDYARYHSTVRENIWFGNVDLPPDDEQIVAAGRHSGADGVITGLPNGYETIIGKWFDNGEELSIGEWQKVALARAFLRDAQIIVLDEPTSSMDVKGEYEVFRKFRQLADGKAAILISHRFSTVRMADRIYVLSGGRIIESGSHDELVLLDGTYARMFETQAQYYQ